MARRMVKLGPEFNGTQTVVEAAIMPSTSPYNADGWIDVTDKHYQGEPVSVGWVWDGVTYSPPPQPQKLPAKRHA